ACAASNPEIYAECSVVVSPNVIAVEKVVLSQEEWLPDVDDEIDIVATVIPDDATDKTLNWSSSDPNIVSVDENGHAKAVAAGEAWIRVCVASNPEIYAECSVVVSPNVIAVEKVVLSQDEWLARTGDEIDLVATVLPEDATDKTLTWSSSDPNIVRVEENGHANAVVAGEACIRVCVASNPEIYAECHVTVDGPVVESEIIWDQEFRCAVGESVELTGYSSDGSPILYESIVPNGGFGQADIHEEDGKFIVSFLTEGAYILTAKTAYKSVEKRFNVVQTHDGLMQIDGIYYRFTDDQRSSLKVVRGYDMYSGDYVIPAKANGIPVTYIDNWAFYSCMELHDVEVEEGIMSFGRESFGNSTLHSISIPSTVKSLADNYIFNALRGNLQSISLHGNIPPKADKTTFNGFVNYEECIVHIPEGSYPLYSTSPIWENFKHLIDDLPNDELEISIKISAGDRTIVVGESLELQALVLPSEYAEEVCWESSDPGIVSVDNVGVITGVSPGIATIYAKVRECYETITVNVESGDGTQIIKGNDNLKLSMNGMDVILQGLPEESVISIIRTDGVIISKTIATSSEMRISIDRRGIYIIRVNDRMYKIII
ncbi:MAG: Ig-like domain-containing protein, partial [Muribaculaceae bacterium]|nr:Ig-like domain-containing protein [Muribaculaceae bacterium]